MIRNDEKHRKRKGTESKENINKMPPKRVE